MTKTLKKNRARTPKDARAASPGTTVEQTLTPERTADPAPKPASKIDQVIALLCRPEGATLDELVAATGWLPHTTRAALTGLKKKGRVINSEKIDGVRRYRIDKSS